MAGPAHFLKTLDGESRSLFGLPADVAERLRHALIAASIGLVLLLGTLLYPVDLVIWTLQTKINPQEPSGEFVFIGFDDIGRTGSEAKERKQVAHVLRSVEKSGAKRVYVDLAFDDATNTQTDAELKSAIQKLGTRVKFVDRIGWNDQEIRKTSSYFTPASNRVYAQDYLDFLGFKWYDHYTYSYKNRTLPSFASSLAEIEGKRQSRFPIDYRYDDQAIQAFSARSVHQIARESLT